jgi:hypothetical protein
MNKKMLREAVQIAIQDSHESDAKSARKRRVGDDSAKYYRLSSCLAVFAGAVRIDCPDVSDAIMSFLHHVVDDTNPLLDAVNCSGKTK